MTEELKNKMIKDYVNGMTARDVGNKYGYCTSTICRLMKKENVSRGRYSFKRVQITENVIKDFKSGLYCEDIAKKYNIEVHTIYSVLDQAGLKRQSGYHSQSNINYFEKIDTPNKAYILGFITADGGVVERTLGIEVKREDDDVLKFIASEINPNATIKPSKYGGKDDSRVIFCSIKMINDLAKYGVIRNKSKTIQRVPEELIPKELLCYYFRGLIDGDGCVHKDGGVSIYSGSQPFIEDVQRIICRDSGAKQLGIYHGSTYFVKWTSKKDRQKLYNYLYNSKLNNTFYYKRKYKRLYNSLFGNTEVNNSIAKGELSPQSIDGE